MRLYIWIPTSQCIRRYIYIYIYIKKETNVIFSFSEFVYGMGYAHTYIYLGGVDQLMRKKPPHVIKEDAHFSSSLPCKCSPYKHNDVC